MNEIKIKCPTCGKILRLADAPNINQATFTCPICKEKHIVGKCYRLVDTPSIDKTQYRGNSYGENNCDETQIGNSSIGCEETKIANDGDKTRIGSALKQQMVGRLVDNSGREYQLCLGVNTIGRKATTSTASVQIITNDRYMSRNHAVIEVQQIGEQTVHILKNGANKNPSYLNGSLVAANDQLILNDGNRLTFGKTELTFKK